MTRNEALRKIGETLGISLENAEWVFIDMTEKIDSGLYGAVYYL